MASVADPPDTNNALADETPDARSRVALAASILDRQVTRNPDATLWAIELAIYEAQLALAGHSAQAITDWHGLAARS